MKFECTVKPNDNGDFHCRKCKEWHPKKRMKARKNNPYGAAGICRMCDSEDQAGYREQRKARMGSVTYGVRLGE